MIAADIYKSIGHYFSNHEHMMLNKYIFRRDWESDLFCVSKSGYCIEVEVKVSKGDFMADFKKPKHNFFKAVLLKKAHYIENKGERQEYNMNGLDNSRYLKAPCTSIRIHKLDNTIIIPNRFWYAFPEGMVQTDLVPKYAGIIVISQTEKSYFGYKYGIIRNAPFIHKNKLDLTKLLFDKYVWGYQQQKNEIESLKRALTRLGKLKEVENDISDDWS